MLCVLLAVGFMLLFQKDAKSRCIGRLNLRRSGLRASFAAFPRESGSVFPVTAVAPSLWGRRGKGMRRLEREVRGHERGSGAATKRCEEAEAAGAQESDG